MRKTLIALLGLLMPAAFLVVATPASADTPGCATYAEWQEIQEGWRRTRVHKTLDTAGIVTFTSANSEYREYQKCNNPDKTQYADYVKRSDGLWYLLTKYEWIG